jgi:glycosyltransferase involved in cell wall biosynthesis
MSMRELLLLCEYPTLNGGERSMLATLDALPASGFAPVVMAPPTGPLAETLAARCIEVLPFDCRAVDGSRLPQNRLREQLADAIRRRRPALLHANSLAMGRLSGPVAESLRLPSLSHVRDIVGLSAQAVADVNCHARLIAVSQATRDFHIAGGLAPDKTYVVYNGVDLQEFCPRQPSGYLHRELGLPPDARLVGTIGQLGPRKGQDLLLHAAETIADHLPDVHYLIVGQRCSQKDESRRFQHALHDALRGLLAERVHFLGVRGDVCRLLNEFSLLVHPARQEPLGRVLLEAAAAGVAIVATDVGGTAEIFPPESDSARLVPPDNADALGEAIRNMLADPALCRRLGAAARRRAEQQFDIRTTVGRLLEHYHALV